jgi:hypothetical protein
MAMVAGCGWEDGRALAKGPRDYILITRRTNYVRYLCESKHRNDEQITKEEHTAAVRSTELARARGTCKQSNCVKKRRFIHDRMDVRQHVLSSGVVTCFQT